MAAVTVVNIYNPAFAEGVVRSAPDASHASDGGVVDDGAAHSEV